MHDRLYYLLLYCILMFYCKATAVPVKGRTQEGMPFKGNVVSTAEGFINLSNSANQQVSIPIRYVANMEILVAPGQSSDWKALFDFPELLGLWEPVVRECLIAHVQQLCDHQSWPDCYHKADLLLKAEHNPLNRIKLLEIKALAVFEMGLHGQCAELLEDIKKTVEPTSLSSRYCWLMTRLAMAENRLADAKYWATVPELMIPQADDELAIELQNLSKTLEKEK
jgi:hypothetical protein